MIVYSTVHSEAGQRKHQSSASLNFVWGNSPMTGEFPAQIASNAENVSIWWRHHGLGPTIETVFLGQSLWPVEPMCRRNGSCRCCLSLNVVISIFTIRTTISRLPFWSHALSSDKNQSNKYVYRQSQGTGQYNVNINTGVEFSSPVPLWSHHWNCLFWQYLWRLEPTCRRTGSLLGFTMPEHLLYNVMYGMKWSYFVFDTEFFHTR